MKALMMKMAAEEAAKEEIATKKKAGNLGRVVGAGLKGAVVGELAHGYGAHRSLARSVRTNDTPSKLRENFHSKAINTLSRDHKTRDNAKIIAMNHAGKIVGGAIGAGREMLRIRRGQ
jgi:hypothetical protein